MIRRRQLGQKNLFFQLGKNSQSLTLEVYALCQYSYNTFYTFFTCKGKVVEIEQGENVSK